MANDAQFWFFGVKHNEAEYDACVKQFNESLVKTGNQPESIEEQTTLKERARDK